jgi:hypothetical protein
MTMGSHQTSVGKNDSRFTPQWLWRPLNPFATDAATGAVRPWDIGTERNITIADNCLAMDWQPFGRTWLNPPFNRFGVGAFVRKMCEHNHGIMLLHNRPETKWFRPIFGAATARLYLDRRVIFCNADGSPCTIENPEAKHYGKQANSGAPVVLIAFGFPDADVLYGFDIANNPPGELHGNFEAMMLPVSVLVRMIEAPPSWRALVASFLRSVNRPVSVAEVYEFVRGHDKTRDRAHWREKVRQTLVRGAGLRIAPNQWVAAA